MKAKIGSNSPQWHTNHSTNIIKVPPLHTSFKEAVLPKVLEVCATKTLQELSNWMLDSRASTHITDNLDLLTNIKSTYLSTITTTNRKLILVKYMYKRDITYDLKNFTPWK